MMDIEQTHQQNIEAAARKALIIANPVYYSWSADEQEHFRATLDDTSSKKIMASLLKSLCGIKCKPENASQAWDDAPVAAGLSLNWAMLLTTGIGEDHIYLNEAMADTETLLTFKTLYDSDYKSHLFQEQENHKAFKDYEGRPYYGLRFSLWIRLLIDRTFWYGSIESLAGHIVDRIDEAGNDLIGELIPFEYKDGKNNGKKEGGGFLMDFYVSANGLESHLKELQDRWHKYFQNDLFDRLHARFENEVPAVYSMDDELDDDPHRYYIFANATTLKKIRWKHFLNDCTPLLSSYSTAVTPIIERETQKMATFIRSAHQDIMDNFDPTVVKLKPKKKIIMMEDALNAFQRMDDDNNE